MLSIRLPSELENKLREAAASYGISTSAYVRRVLAEKLAEEQQQQHPFPLGEALFGRYASADTNLAENAEQRLREKLQRKQASDQARATGQ